MDLEYYIAPLTTLKFQIWKTRNYVNRFTFESRVRGEAIRQEDSRGAKKVTFLAASPLSRLLSKVNMSLDGERLHFFDLLVCDNKSKCVYHK